MDGFKMDPDYSVCRMTLQNLLQTRDLSYPIQVESFNKDTKDYSEVCPTTAAFLGPNLWDEYKTAFIDIDRILSGSPENEQHLNPLEGFQEAINENAQALHVPVKEVVEDEHIEKGMVGPDLASSEITPVVESRQNFSEIVEIKNKRQNVDYKFSPTDLALATPPGHKHYDPSSTVFPDDELKPQPIIKKSRKNFVPDSLKDDKYWARRHKNNIAAKRSREARRLKENQIVLRASYLEKENNTLKEDVVRLRAENEKLKEKIKKYES